MHLDLEDGLVALGLLGAVAAMLAIAPALRIPYPILLVLGGLAIGVIPGMRTSSYGRSSSFSAYCRLSSMAPLSSPRSAT